MTSESSEHASRENSAVVVFTTAMFVSATVMFLVQPFVGKILLPVLGGSAAVWNTCMVFFQAVLLCGYLYAHLLTTRVGAGWQVAIHLALLAAAATCLPLAVAVNPPWTAPVPWLIVTLATTIGPPFLALSATAPLLQAWFVAARSAPDPYFLYAASNAGSLAGLLLYPAVVEPLCTRREQSLLVTAGYGLLAALVAACGLRAARGTAADPIGRRLPAGGRSLALADQFLIVVLAFVPSSLMLGATQHITSDVAAIPLLWVLPLAVYLLTFILAFATWPRLTAADWGRALPIAAAPACFFLLSSLRNPLLLLIAGHLALLFVAAMMCHRRLHELRPTADRLTSYYLLVSLGGVLGGSFNALVAPLIFPGIWEYPLAIAAACLLIPLSLSRSRRPPLAAAAAAAAAGFGGLIAADTAVARGWIGMGAATAPASIAVKAALPLMVSLGLAATGRPWLFAATLGGALFATQFTGSGGDVLFQGRSFFGVHKVTLHPGGGWITLAHGTTIHGVQARQGVGSETLDRLALEPTTYYSRSGPLGDVVASLADRGHFRRCGVIGLGCGTIAAYAQPGTRFDFFEIDPLVVRIAADRRFFSYVSDAIGRRAQVTATVGDGRLAIAAMPAHAYDLVVVDAFASDSVPLHLLTREALAVYAERLHPAGLIAFNVSSRYFDLAPPIAAVAAGLNLASIVRRDTVISQGDREAGKRESIWVVVGSEAALAPLRGRGGWDAIPTNGRPSWTDDHSNLLEWFVGW